MNTLARFRNAGYGRTLVAILFVLVYLFPVYWMVATSLKTSAAIFATPPQVAPSPPVFTAYSVAVINNPATIRAILNSMIISLGTMALTLVLAAPAAYALARLRGATLITRLLLITQLLPAIVIATPLFVLFSRIKLLNSYPALILANTTF
jgi:multiple sugar transport system permease protein